MERFGDTFSRGLEAVTSQFGKWMGISALAVLFGLIGVLLCLVGLLVLSGPISAGMFACALAALRRESFDSRTFGVWQEVFGTAVGGGLAMVLVVAGPFFLVYLVAGGVMVGMGATGDPGAAAAGSVLMFLVLMVGAPLAWVWQLWIGTKLVFVIPLIVDQRLSVGDAWRESWRLSGIRFWELLLLNFLATLLASLGIYLCVVGALFSMPVYFTVIAQAYRDRRGEMPASIPGVPDMPPAAGGA